MAEKKKWIWFIEANKIGSQNGENIFFIERYLNLYFVFIKKQFRNDLNITESL